MRYNQAEVILSRLRDTMYHADVIVHFGHFKSIYKGELHMCILVISQDLTLYFTYFSFPSIRKVNFNVFKPSD